MCDATDPDFLIVSELAATTKDADLAAALTLIARCRKFPHHVNRALLNGAACMVDAAEAVAALFTHGGTQ